MTHKVANACWFVGLSFLCSLFLSLDLAYAQNGLKVGVVVDFSGFGAAWGQSIKNGIMMALDDIRPEIRHDIELIFEDDQSSAKNDATAFNKLANVDHVDALISLWSVAGSVIAPLAERKKIPFIAIASDRKLSENRDYVVNLYVDPAEESRIAIEEAKLRGYKKIAHISVADAWGEATLAAFNSVNRGDLKVVISEQYPMDVADFRPFIMKLRQYRDVDAVMIILNPGQCGLFAKQYHELGGDKPMFAFESFEDKSEIERSNGAIIGHWYVNFADPDHNFRKRYEEKYSADVLLGAYGYDAMMLLSKAYQQDKSKQTIMKSLTTVEDHYGAAGVFASINHNDYSLPAGVKVVTKQGSEQIRESRR